MIPPSLPGLVVCVGRNFRDHAQELGNLIPKQPVFFIKSPRAIIGPGDTIRIPPETGEVHHEAEVAVELGRSLHRAEPGAAAQAIAAWTVLNDVTARDLQKADNGRFCRAKCIDTFCPVSDKRLATLDAASARIQCHVNGTLRQDGALADWIFDPPFALSYISRFLRLEAGDLVALGTPAGVGPLNSGDEVEVRLVDGVGTTLIELTNPVRAVE